MIGFFIGQRVRIRWSLAWPELNGQAGRIIDKLSDAQRRYLPVGHSGEWEVAPDAWGGSASPDAVGFFFPASEQLEPLIPNNMQPVFWGDCAWQPDELRSEAPRLSGNAHPEQGSGHMATVFRPPNYWHASALA